MHPSQTNPPVSPSRPESLLEEDRYLMRTHKIALRPTRRQRRLLKQHADYYPHPQSTPTTSLKRNSPP